MTIEEQKLNLKIYLGNAFGDFFVEHEKDNLFFVGHFSTWCKLKEEKELFLDKKTGIRTYEEQLEYIDSLYKKIG